MQLSEKIKSQRQKLGLTQDELAERSNVTIRTIQRLENGICTPRAYTLKAISAALNLGFEELSAYPDSAEENTEKEINVCDAHNDYKFLVTILLSCYSFLVLPYVHYLIPHYISKKTKNVSANAKEQVDKIVWRQLIWQIALHGLMLSILFYNVFLRRYFFKPLIIDYLTVFFLMIGINSIIITMALIRLRLNNYISLKYSYLSR
ncbi:MAG: helix-turn-helix transcriptional regulator [Niabella sp.]|nr:helix-turn-helix transcriptional regulator [Niabella sp.]